MRYDWSVEVDGEDISGMVKAAGTIDYGRPTRSTGFQAPTAVFDLFTKDENPNPAPPVWPDIRLGSVVIIHATWDGFTQSRRFSGIVQALDWGLYGLRVTATGALVDGPDAPSSAPYPAAVDWQTRWAGETGPVANYPAAGPQLETDRVRWLVEDQAGFQVEVEGTPARRIRAIPVNSLGQPLLDAVLRVADDCDGLLMMDRLGVMRYRTKNFTRPARVILPPHLVESTSIDLAYERGSIVNQVTVFYGEPDPVTGNQPAVSEQDTQSIIEHGERRAEMYTDIQYESGARGKATDHLVKNQAAWEAPDVTLLMNQATGVEADAIWELQENWRVSIAPLPAGCPIGSYDGDILGFTEVMHETDYRIILHLAPPFGDENAPPEEPIFDADSISGGTVSTYEDQYGHLWQLHRWETAGSGTFTVNKALTARCLAVAGGGAGGYRATSDGGAGGGGGVWEYDLDLKPGTVAFTVGAGGTTSGTQMTGGSGQDTTVAGLTVKGGGGGVGWDTAGRGLDGGSGGGRRGMPVQGTGGNVAGFHGGPAGTSGNGGGASGSGRAGWVSNITGVSREYGPGGPKGGDPTPRPPIHGADGVGGGGEGGAYGGAGHGGCGGIYLAYRVG